MPAFIMPIETTKAVMSFRALDTFAQGYVEAMFFTETGHMEDEDCEDATFDDLSPEALATIASDCAAFQSANRALLEEAYGREYTEEQAGRDYWFTRNGHGVGFWDRRELREGGLGDKLSAACRCDAVTLYMGDDGLLYLM